MPTQRKRPQDLTGRQTEALARQRDEDASRAAEISMATAAAEREELENTVIDLTAKPEVQDTGPVEIASPTRRVRVTEDLEDTIFGHGNFYTLKAGQQYVLPREFADHLDRLGFVYH